MYSMRTIANYIEYLKVAMTVELFIFSLMGNSKGTAVL